MNVFMIEASSIPINILSLFDIIRLNHLEILDTIEQDILTHNNSIIQNILNSKKKDYIEL